MFLTQTAGNAGIAYGIPFPLFIGFGASAPSSDETSKETLLPVAGIIKSFHVKLKRPASGSGTATLTPRINGVDQPGLAIADSGHDGATLTLNAVFDTPVNAGDILTIKCENIGNSTFKIVSVAVVID